MNPKQSKTPLCDDIIEKLSVSEKDVSSRKLPFYYLEKIKAESALQTARDTERIAESLERLVQLVERNNRRHG